MLVSPVQLGKLATSKMAEEIKKRPPAFCPNRPCPGCRRIPDLTGGFHEGP
jgi:hypothetical protein